MKSPLRWLSLLALVLAFAWLIVSGRHRPPAIGPVVVHRAAAFDRSPRLASLRGSARPSAAFACGADCGSSMGEADEDDADAQPARTPPASPPVTAAAAAIEQKSPGPRPALPTVASFDGLGLGFDGPQGQANGRNPSDNSLAVGPDRVVQVVNSRMAVFSKQGKVLYGAVPTNTIFQGFGGPCEERNNGDAVVRYDQLAGRWLFILPIFNRIVGRPDEPYAMCYALSEDADPLGSYYRYEFRRQFFPDYPRPAVWPDGYYVASSTGDNIIQKHACVADRATMLKGRDASEQCLILEGVNFLNNADLDGQNLPPTGAPNLVMAAGGSQLRQILDDDGIYAWQFHVDWADPRKTALTGPVKIAVAPYRYLCGGRLTNCVPQPGATMRLDAQGDKIMQRLTYRNAGGHESVLAVQSVATAAGGGGVRWYEFRLDDRRDPVLYQQGTYAPGGFYRWMASPAMDRAGNIAIGYSFGGTPHFPGQRFAARLAGDPLGQLTFAETALASGEGVQTDGNRWEDYATLAVDPADDCTFWYVGDYYRAGAAAYSSRIGAFRLPGCVQRPVSGFVFLDRNHDGRRDFDEPGLPGVPIVYAGAQDGSVTTGANGSYTLSLPADPLYQSPVYRISARASTHPAWAAPGQAITVSLRDPAGAGGVDFAVVCTVANRGGAGPQFWAGAAGQALLRAHNPAWRNLLPAAFPLPLPADPGQAYEQFRQWLATSGVAPQLAATALNIAYGAQDGDATLHDPVAGDWPTIRALVTRVNGLPAGEAAAYRDVLEQLNGNSLRVTPSQPAACGPYE